MAKTRVASRRARRAPRPRRKNRTPFLVTAAAWALILILWAGQVFRATGSVVFLLALSAALVYTGVATVDAVKGRDPWRGARRAVLLWLLMSVPVAFDPTAVEPFNPFKYLIIMIGALTVAALWAIEWLRSRRAPLWRNGLQWTILALVVWTAISAATSSNVRVSLLGYRGSYDGLYATIALAVVTFAFVEAFSVRDLRTVLSVVYFAAGGPVVVYGLLQLHDRTFGGARWDWVDWGEATFKGSTIWATFGNPNHLAGFLAMLLPVGLVLFFLHRDWRPRVLIGVITLLATLEVLQTTTRGAWLAAIGALALAVVMVLPEIRARPRLAGLFAVTLIVGLGGASLVLASTRNLRDQLTSILDFGGGSTAVQRIEIWKASADMAADRPLVGFGPDTFRFPFFRYQTAKIVGLYGPDLVANGAHNVVVNYLATTGFPGALAFLALISAAAARAGGAYRRLRRREREAVREGDAADEVRRTRLLLTAVAAGTAAYLIQALFNTQKIMLTFMFWAFLGMLGVIAREAGVPDSLRPGRLLAATETGAAPPPEDAPRRPKARGRRRRAEWWPLAATGVAGVAAFLAWTQAGPYRAEHSYREALILRNTFSSEGIPQDQRAQLLRRARENFLEAAAANPWDAVYHEGLGRLDFEAARLVDTDQPGGTNAGVALDFLREAAEAYRRAISLEPANPLHRQSLAQILVEMRTIDPGLDPRRDAVDALRAAVAANPWQPRFGVLLATILADLGDSGGALRALDRTLAFSPRSEDALRKAGQIAQAADLTDRARQYWERLLALKPDDEEAKGALGRT